MSQLLLEVPDQKNEPKEKAQVLVEVDKIPCDNKTDPACTKRWLESQSDCV
jgi:hypothetical protein